MGETHGYINDRVVITRPKLGQGEEVEVIGLQQNAFCDNLLKVLRTDSAYCKY